MGTQNQQEHLLVNSKRKARFLSKNYRNQAQRILRDLGIVTMTVEERKEIENICSHTQKLYDIYRQNIGNENLYFL